VASLAQSIALLFALTYAYSYSTTSLDRLPTRTQRILRGLIFSVFGVVGLFTGTETEVGFLLGGHTVIIAIATLFSDCATGSMAALVVIVFRILIGGAGVPVTIASVLTTVLLGCALRRYQQQRQIELNWQHLLMLGLAVAFQRLLWTFLLAGSQRYQMLDTLWVPVLLLFPAGIMLLGTLMLRQSRHEATERALQQSEARYRSVITAMSEGVILHDADGRIITSNTSAARMFGLSTSDLHQRTVFDLLRWAVHEDGTPLASDIQPSVKVLQTGQPHNQTILGLYRSDGSLCWIKMNAQPLTEPDSRKVCGVVLTLSDMTIQKLAQDKLIQERDLLRTLIDSMPDYIFIKDTQGRYVISNEAHALAAKSSAEALVGHTAYDFFSPELAAQFHADDQTVFRTGQPIINVERESITKDGQPITMLITKVPLRNRIGAVVGLVGVSRDITDRKLYEQRSLELEAERQRIKLLHRFIADISHDFRTPLTVINNSIYLLERIAEPDKRKQHLDRIQEQVHRIGHLLDELLEAERLGQDDSEPVFTEVDLNPLVHEVVQNYEAAARQQGLELNFDFEAHVANVLGDAQWLRKAVANLIENALQFTPAGGAVCVRTFSENAYTVIEVSDTGVGIPEQALPLVFEHFYRADVARSTQTGGVGLGLTITHKIIEAHNGTITAQSVPDHGSVFTIRLPALAETLVL
jgi:PAS domain S-box-containing protein